MKKPVLNLMAGAVLALSAVAAHAGDVNVTNNVIVGTGIANNGFTVGATNNIEIGLRARERYGNPTAGVFVPTNNFYSDNNGTYNQAPGGFTPVGVNGTAGGPRAAWNFDWSINTDQSGTGGAKINSYTYRLSMDFDAGVGTNFQSFDLINAASLFDHSFGDNTTGQGLGVEAANAAGYTSLKGSSNLVQNSWNYDFFDSAMFPFDPNAQGTYTIKLEAFRGDTLAASSLINVNVGAAAVPEPGSMALVGLALAGLAIARRRKA